MDRVISKATGKVYARKRINRKRFFGHDTQAQKIYENEIKVLSKVKGHDHLIKVAGTYTDRKHLVMLLEPVADGNLKQYMNRGSLTSTTEQRRFRTYFGCLAHTIRFLHDPSIETLHKDIKPENILLKDDHLILTDFGTAFDWSKTGQSMTRSNAGDNRTPRYQSPEVASSNEFHRSSDIWSLGVVFLEMVTFLRGKRIADMDTFLQSHGHRHTEIHLNLDAAIDWFEQLQAHGGSVFDNEPLSWIKYMLNREQSRRPTAETVYQDIASFHDGMFCGRCCLDTESSSSADDYYDDDVDTLSDIIEHDELSPEDLGIENRDVSWTQKPSFSIEGPEKEENELSDFQEVQGDSLVSPTGKENARLRTEPEADTVAPFRTEKDVRHHSKHRHSRVRRSKRSQGQGSTEKLSTTSGMSDSKKVTIEVANKPSFDKETFVRWLASTPERFRASPSGNRQVKPASLSRRPSKRDPTVESQRIGHFLSSLPEESSQYETHSEQGIDGLDRTKRSQTLPTFYEHYVERSLSQVELFTPSHLLAEEFESEQLSGATKSRLVHYMSDHDLGSATATSNNQTLREITQELRAFAATTKFMKLNGPEATASKGTDEASTTPSQTLETPLNAAAQPDLEHLNREPEVSTSDFASTRSHPTTVNEPPRLAAYLKDVPKKPSRQWESANVIMKRILEDKMSEAPTSVMSVNTRATVSQSRPLLRWNDEFYGYLPSFITNGKVGAVRELLRAGCNPGTREKPRWAPISNAIRGATDKHTKCLRALVSHGVNVNAIKKSTGKRPLHYAVEKAPWPGYSSVIYTLLDAGADPNATDNANDVPLLMLLAGRGPLPQGKRDALYLLLAPNFATNLDVSIKGTLDNALHLAVRRKDAYTVDVILEKLKQVRGDALKLPQKRNGTGLTPLLLAFTNYPLLGEEADEELQIIKLLLENGADPNDQDTTHGQTPLHTVVSTSKNTIALELLCTHSANATMPNHAGESPINMAQRFRLEHPKDKWYLFAKRLMSKQSNETYYRSSESAVFEEMMMMRGD